jgi:exodeoxyribonuclease VII small subunit
MPQQPADDAPQTFEGSLAQLQQIVNELEEGSVGLETSLARFEEGVRLLKNCYQILESAEQKIEILTGMDEAGMPVTEPFEAAATFESGGKPVRKPGRRRATSKADPAAGDDSSATDSGERKTGGLF